MGSFADLCELLARQHLATPLIFGLALLLRVAVGLSSYSGAGTPPVFGDYEAQRHWMEVTLHTPVREWYSETADNNLSYWGLDYPPLTAYQSWVHGKMMAAVDPDAVSLGVSRGFESSKSKLAMRWTVLSADLCVFFPAAWLAVETVYRDRRRGERAWALAMIVFQPGLILIDHGHFQYNCISLGLALAAAAVLGGGWEILASVLFSLSLNHKQMGAYYAPAFLFHLLGTSARRPAPLLAVARLGVTVMAVFALCWLPYLHSQGSILQVLSRLAPFHRGLYEDHVANFWCASNLLVKWKHRLPTPTLARLAAAATLLAASPSLVTLLRRPTAVGFIYGMANSSLAFFLFSFQVHEKSILLPLLPISLLSLHEPALLAVFSTTATFSMFPLLVRDGLGVPYVALTAFFLLCSIPPKSANLTFRSRAVESPPWPVLGPLPWRALAVLSLAGACVLHALHVIMEPPPRYPYLYTYLMILLAFLHIAAAFVYIQLRHWTTVEKVKQI